MEQNTNKHPLRLVIIILAILLMLALAALVIRVIYLNSISGDGDTVVVPENFIGETTAPTGATEPSDSSDPTESTGTTEPTEEAVTPTIPVAQPPNLAESLTLFEGKPGDNDHFQVENMFPGDLETGYYCLRVWHDAPVTLYFRLEITEQTKLLGSILNIKVTHMNDGTVLYDGSFDDIVGKEFPVILQPVSSGCTDAYYKIEVSLPTSAGNEFQAALLQADFDWYVKSDEGLIPPKTGDEMNLPLYLGLGGGSLVLLIVLLVILRRRSKKEDENAE